MVPRAPFGSTGHESRRTLFGAAALGLAREGRDRFFLATKTGKRTHAEARDEIRLSLRRLGVDHVDLIQLHNLVDRTEWEIAMGPDGALRAAVEARDAGLA